MAHPWGILLPQFVDSIYLSGSSSTPRVNKISKKKPIFRSTWPKWPSVIRLQTFWADFFLIFPGFCIKKETNFAHWTELKVERRKPGKFGSQLDLDGSGGEGCPLPAPSSPLSVWIERDTAEKRAQFDVFLFTFSRTWSFSIVICRNLPISDFVAATVRQLEVWKIV